SNGTADDTLALLRESADVAERLRTAGTAVTLIVGLEMSGFLKGIIPGESVLERLELLSDPARLMPTILALGTDPRNTMSEFLAEAVETARSRFAGPLTYGAGLWEEIDWSLFDMVGIDAYRDAQNREGFEAQVRSYLRFGKPVVATEFGCATFRGADDLGSMAWTVADRRVGPARLTSG